MKNRIGSRPVYCPVCNRVLSFRDSLAFCRNPTCWYNKGLGRFMEPCYSGVSKPRRVV